MIPAGQDAAGGHPGLLESLMAPGRPEFRADEPVFGPQDPVFGGKLCLVAGCCRTAHGQGCVTVTGSGGAAGRPEVRAFAAAADPRWRKDAPLTRCRSAGCSFGVTRRRGLCARHAGAWERDGMPDLQNWLDRLPDTAPAVMPADCLIGSCQLWAEPGSELRRSHSTTWKQYGRPPRSSPSAGEPETGFPVMSGSGCTACWRT